MALKKKRSTHEAVLNFTEAVYDALNEKIITTIKSLWLEKEN